MSLVWLWGRPCPLPICVQSLRTMGFSFGLGVLGAGGSLDWGRDNFEPRLFGVVSLSSEVTRVILSGEEVFYLLDEDVAAHVADGFGEGELLGAGLDAVLGEAALLDAAVSG